MDIPEIADARVLRLRPGDVLALRLDHCPDDAEIEGIVTDLRNALPDVKVLLFAPGTEISVITRPEEPDPGAS